MKNLELKAKTIIQNLPYFSFDAFNKEFDNNSYLKIENFKTLFTSIIEEKMKQRCISTAVSYRCSLRLIEAYSPNLKIFDITPDFLKNLEDYWIKNGKSITTIGIYFRNLRAVINQAIQKKLLPKENYHSIEGVKLLHPDTPQLIIRQRFNDKIALRVDGDVRIW